MAEQEKYFCADEEFPQAFADEIAKKTGDMFFKKSDAAEIVEQTAINKSSIGLQKKNLLKPTLTSGVYSGIMCTIDYDGFINANGVADMRLGGFYISKTPLMFEKDVVVSFIGNIEGVTLTISLNDGQTYVPLSRQPNNEYIVSSGTKIDTIVVQAQEKDITVVIQNLAVMIRYADITDDMYEPYVDDLQTQINNINPDLFFKKMGVIDDATDWNTITEMGCYKVQMSDSGWGNAEKYHSPNEYSSYVYWHGLLAVFKSNIEQENRLIQIYFPNMASYIMKRRGCILVRESNNNNWYEWTPITKGVDVTDIGNYESQIITLTNTVEYPFNDSQKTVSITNTRFTTDYEVDTEIMSPANGEQVGRIVVTDKLTNGFKIAYTGSAPEVQIKCAIKGGMS